MKKLFKTLFITSMVFLCTEAIGQKIGAKAGLNLATMLHKNNDYTYSDDYSLKPGFHIGGIIDLEISDMLSLEPGVFFSTKGSREKDGDIVQKLNLTYFEIPVNLKFSYSLGDITLIGFGGPSLSMAITGKYVTKNDGDKDTDNVDWGKGHDSDLKRPDLGLMFGAGVEFDSFQFSISYNLGLANISAYTDNGLKIKNRVLGISAAYFFTEL